MDEEFEALDAIKGKEMAEENISSCDKLIEKFKTDKALEDKGGASEEDDSNNG